MKLERVTISGADDKSDVLEIRRITGEFPFVEWGLLMSTSRLGTPRYPSLEATHRIAEAAPGRIAFHLCGSAALRVFHGDAPPGTPPRVQLNGFSQVVDQRIGVIALGQAITRLREQGSEVILQVQSERALVVAGTLRSVHKNVSALWDESGGRGIAGRGMDAWPDPPGSGLRLGYAGGITPENVSDALFRVRGKPGRVSSWIDMESGVRTDGELDFDKVRRVLAEAAPFVRDIQQVLS